MSKDYIVFSQKLAGYLMLQGFRLIRMDKSNKQNNSHRHIFIFNESEALLQHIQNYKSN